MTTISKSNSLPRRGWALYLRTSNMETQNPANSQRRQRHAIKHNLLRDSNLPVIEEYVDNLSGASTKHRPAYLQLLSDARIGRFSHVAVENAERFGRNDTEALTTIDELHALGISVRFADYPELDPINADDRIMVSISFTLARRESMKLGQRVKGGLQAKLRQGGHNGRAPDGYINCEKRNTSDKLQNGQYIRWVEPDPDRFHIWREAWDLLLEDRYTLEEICHKLHLRGYTYRSGRAFIQMKDGQRIANKNGLSFVFHNWFYAGWVVSPSAKIPPKTVKGMWQPAVTTEEFEEGLAILDRRNRHKLAKRKHEYLLKGLVYLQQPNRKQPVKLTCSTSNSNRPNGGTAYYCIPKSNVNIRCEIVDHHLNEQIKRIQVDPETLPEIRQRYKQEVADKLRDHRPDERTHLEKQLKVVDEEEKRALRLYVTGKITDAVWENMWAEWQDRRSQLQMTLKNLGTEQQAHISNLDVALDLIAKISVLYDKLNCNDKSALLRLIVEKVIIDQDGNVMNLKLRPPFAYLRQIAHQVDELVVEKEEADCSSIGFFSQKECSDYVQMC